MKKVITQHTLFLGIMLPFLSYELKDSSAKVRIMKIVVLRRGRFENSEGFTF